MSYYSDVKLFHDRFGLVTHPSFTLLPEDLHTFRVKFLQEEYQEYVDSCKSDDLGTAVDSLIDLVYVCCGTLLLHGVSPTEFDQLIINEDDLYEENVFYTVDEPLKLKPGFLSPVVNANFTNHLQELIEAYTEAHSVPLTREAGFIQELRIRGVLASLYLSTLAGSSLMGVSITAWDEMWADVQRANMAKERVLKAEDSKRGSTWDVRKPEGWVPPRTEEILRTYL